jgi:hypothetical protein
VKGRWTALLAALAVATVLAPPARPAAAQDTTLVQPDSLAPADSAAADTVVVERVPIAPVDVPLGPLPPGSRYTFTRDSLFWTDAITLSDLLRRVPGVYIARGGFLKQPEYLLYGGRGAAGIEVYWDGFRLLPVGQDSIYFDPSQVTLSFLRRVDVEVRPGGLRVYLVSERHESTAERSVIRVMSGAFSTAQYAGVFQKRWASGFGLTLAGDFTSSEGGPELDRGDQTLDLWAKVEWLPGENVGVAYQMRRAAVERDEVASESGGVTPFRDGNRTEAWFTLFAGSPGSRLGAHAEFGLGSAAWSDSILGDQRIHQAYARLRWARPFVTVEAEGRMADRRITESVEARVDLVPIRGVVFSSYGGFRGYEARPTARFAGAALGLYLGPLFAVGELATDERVAAPAMLADSAQRLDDAAARVGVDLPFVQGRVSLVRRGAFVAPPPLAYPDIAVFDTSRVATYVVAEASLEPIDGVRVHGTYSHPRTGLAPDLQPPKHGRAAVTYRSKFWRTFPSGAFDFELRYGIEFWSGGTAGFDASSNPIALPGATFHEIFLQIQLVDFRIWWNLRNARNTQAQYVPGYIYPRNAQTFGVKWVFSN